MSIFAATRHPIAWDRLSWNNSPTKQHTKQRPTNSPTSKSSTRQQPDHTSADSSRERQYHQHRWRKCSLRGRHCTAQYVLDRIWAPTKTVRQYCAASQLTVNHTISPSVLKFLVNRSILSWLLQIEVLWLNTTCNKSYSKAFWLNAICCRTPSLLIPLA